MWRIFRRNLPAPRLLLLGVVVSIVAGAALVTEPLGPRAHAATSIPNFSHVFLIVMENTSSSHILGSSSAPYLNSIVGKGGLATQFYGFTHYSLPNYFVLTAGQTSMSSYVLNDCASTTADCTQNYVSLPEKIESSGRTWKAYFQSMPSACDTDRVWPYTPHYNPFVYYTRLLSNGDCMKNVVPDTQFYTDLANHTLPNFIWISPDLCHDGHLATSSSGTCPNGGPYATIAPAVGQADGWLSATVPQILASPQYQNGGLLVITWDEGDDGNGDFSMDSSGCCGVANGGHVVTLLLSPYITPGMQQAVPETFYSLLRTIESAWSLPALANEADFSPMSEFFSSTSSAPASSPTSSGAHETSSAPPASSSMHTSATTQPGASNAKTPTPVSAGSHQAVSLRAKPTSNIVVAALRYLAIFAAIGAMLAGGVVAARAYMRRRHHLPPDDTAPPPTIVTG